jgi:predicted transcriptional regulator
MATKILDVMNNFPPRYNLYFDGSKLINEPVNNSQEYDIFLRIMSDPISRIFSGKKKFELRKYVPKHSGLVFLYETDKVQAISGCFYFKNYIVKPINELWKTVGERATSKEKFDSYFGGKEFGVALEIIDFQKFDKPIKSNELYNLFPAFPKTPQPPVYLYSDKDNEFSKFLRTKATDIILRNNL